MFRLFVFSVIIIGVVLGDGYWDIQLSPQSISSVPFGDGHISVWEHAASRGRYYAMPLVYLLQDTATVVESILTDAVELEFEVLMWSVEAKEAVYRHLKANVNTSIDQDHVEMLPMEKIRIVWRDRIRSISDHFKLADHWKSNTHLPSSVYFQFTCSNREKCDRLKRAMLDNPRIFNALEIEYIINGQESARRALTVTGTHLLNGRLFSSMVGSGQTDERYVTADDLKTIVSQSVSNVIGSIVTDVNYVDTGDEVGMKDILLAELSRQEVSSSNFQPHMWESVFWDPTWARPDKITTYLNKVLEKDDNDSRYFILNENERSRTIEGSSGGKFFSIVEANAEGSSTSASKSKVQKEEVLNMLRERHKDVEWTGEVFRVKPVKLYRLNLSTLNTSRHVATANIQVRKYETVHSIKVRLTNRGSELTSSLSPQLLEARLIAKLETIKNETNTKIQSIKSTSQMKFEETNNKITSMESRLNSAVSSTSSSLSGRLNSAEAKLRTLPGWPSGGYCLLARGGCPSGFGRHTATINRISSSGSGRAGDSSVTTFTSGSRDNRYTYSRLTIVACCK